MSVVVIVEVAEVLTVEERVDVIVVDIEEVTVVVAEVVSIHTRSELLVPGTCSTCPGGQFDQSVQL